LPARHEGALIMANTRLATLGWQLQELYQDTDSLAAAVRNQPVRVIKDLQAYRANGEGGYDHQLVPVGSSVTVASVHNQGFNGVKVFSHFDGWTLCADIND